MLGVPERDNRPDPVGIVPFPVLLVGVADRGPGVAARNTEPALGLLVSLLGVASLDVDVPVAVFAPRSTDACRDP